MPYMHTKPYCHVSNFLMGIGKKNKIIKNTLSLNPTTTIGKECNILFSITTTIDWTSAA